MPREDNASSSQSLIWSFPTSARLLIITSDLLAPSLTPLATHKNATGMPTQVLTVTQIRSLSTGADDPERIKRLIALYVQDYGTHYVLLAGDPTQVPTRHRAVLNTMADPTEVSWNFTDYYYANLFTNHTSNGTNSGVVDTWDGNGDGYFNNEYWYDGTAAENPDNVDGYPDVAVGRVPVATTAAMSAYVSKVIAYESPGWWAQSSHTYPAVFVADDVYPGEPYAASIESNLAWNIPIASDLHLELEPQSAMSSPWTLGSASNIESAAGTTPLMFYMGHGGAYCWDHSCTVTNTELDTLANTNQYPVVWAAACDTAQFSPSLQPGGPNDYDWIAQPGSMGATWLTPSGGGGAIAYVGSSIVQEYLLPMAFPFARYVSSGAQVLGDAWHLAEVTYWQAQVSASAADLLMAPRVFLSDEVLLGDPSLRLQVVHRNRAAMARADFDGDGESDLAAFVNVGGGWQIQNSSGLNGPGSAAGQTTVQAGTTSDIPVTGDFDGDGITDIAYFRPSTGLWTIQNSSGLSGQGGANGQTQVQFGTSGDIPITGDFDGDGITDIAYFRPSTGFWTIQNSSGLNGPGPVPGQTQLQYGTSGDIPVAGDFDGDGATDIAVFKPTGYWFIRNSSGGTGRQTKVKYGNPGDIPVAGDFDGDGMSDIAVFRPTTGYWLIKNSSGITGGESTSPGETWTQYGASGDIPVAGDFDGDGQSDLARFQPGGQAEGQAPNQNYWMIKNSSGYTGAGGTAGETRVSFGVGQNTPISSDVRSPYVAPPTKGDINADKRADLVMVGNSAWNTVPVAFSNGDGSFNITNTVNTFLASNAALPGVKDVIGDFDGDGAADVLLTGNPNWGTVPVGFSNHDGSFRVTNLANGFIASNASLPGVKLIAGDFDGDGRSDIALMGNPTWITVPVAFSNGDGTFNVTNGGNSFWASNAAAANVKVVTGDFDGDGRTDIAMMGNAGWNTVPVAFSNGDGSFRVTNATNAFWASNAASGNVKVVTGDFDGDGKTDIAMMGNATWSTVPVAFSNGDGSFRVTNTTNAFWASNAGSANVQVVTGDFDGDGKTDIAMMGNPVWNTVPVAFSNGDGSFRITNTPNAFWASNAALNNVKVVNQY
ncbi:MAG: FG-GAP-like repeat-containing protein [Polyangiaceae bacterium]